MMTMAIKIWGAGFSIIMPLLIVAIITLAIHVAKLSAEAKTTKAIHKELRESSRKGGTVTIKDERGRDLEIRVRKAL